MASSTLYIKNMVCNRCIRVVNEEITNLNFEIESLELGRVDISREPGEVEIVQIKKVLEKNGFELIDDKKSRLIESIKTVVIELIHYEKEKAGHMNISDFIAKEIGYDYSYLSYFFSAVEGTTIEKYLIKQKIERAKELLIYNELSLNEIAWEMGYSSVQHLSGQFKKITGFSPSQFKKVKERRRKPLDKV